MTNLQPGDYRLLAARRKRADAIVKLLQEAPQLSGESFWSSMALHLIDSGYAKQHVEAIPHVMWKG